MSSFAGFTGYGYDLVAIVGFIISHIAKITNTDVMEYYHATTTPDVPIFNVTAPNWEFVAVGAHVEPTNVHMPCLMHNIKSGGWAWSRDIIWYADKDGFCWSGGNYCDEQTARAEFGEYADGVVWHNADY